MRLTGGQMTLLIAMTAAAGCALGRALRIAFEVFIVINGVMRWQG